MVNRSGRTRLAKAGYPSQKSKLLNLPPELRNLIYECVAQNSDTISIREHTIFYCPALSLVCHQTRDEYRQIYLDEAPKSAARINIHLTNFITTMTAGGSISSVCEQFANPAPWIERSWTVRVLLTNLWDRHRLELRNFIEHGDFLKAKYDLELVWDPKSFDAEFLRENVPKMRFCFGRMLHRPELIWPQMEKALGEAFERYSSRSGVAKRKRGGMKVGMPTKKQRRRR